MTLSICINTAALGPRARETGNSQGSAKHAQRAYALRSWILPDYLNDPHVAQVVVAGEWEAPPTDTYTYAPCASLHLTAVDALAARHAAFQVATGDVLVFQHDDHFLDRLSRLQFNHGWPPHFAEFDVLVPARWTFLRTPAGERLNNGEAWQSLPGLDGIAQGAQAAYVSGHCAVYKRAVIERCPWRDVPKRHTWDVAHTAQILDAGFRVGWVEQLRVVDAEQGSTPWQ